MPKILISTSSFNVPANGALESLRAAGCDAVLNPHGRRLSETELSAMLGEDVTGIIAGTERLSRAVLERARSLKIISRCGIGMDNVDLVAARELGIDVVNTPDAPSAAVAELTMGLMLAALRRIAEADRTIRAGDWRPLMGRLLAACTVGVIGYGRIGRRVAALCVAFGARVLVHDVQTVTPKSGIEACTLEQLLASSDIVTLHLPSGVGSSRLLGDERFAAMKRGAILVNTSRGDLVDEAALARALSSGHLAGAALDTFDQEPYRGALREIAQVTCTAHMGSYAQEARASMEEEAARNLLNALERRGLLNAGFSRADAPDKGPA